MALSFLSGSGSASNAKYFDIRLDEDYIIFRGNEQEASSAHLRGTLVLCLSEPLSIKHLKLTLSGVSRISWHVGTTQTAGGHRRAWKERNIYENTWTFRDPGKGKTELLKADNYEYPFDIILQGSLPESIEGLNETWIMYRFKAEIGRKYAKDIQIRKPLRIIRTLDSSALELAHAMAVENIWPNKIEYSISTPSKAVVFGTSLRVDFRLVPLLKGLKVGLISTSIQETHDFVLDEAQTLTNHNNYKFQKTVVSDEYVLDDEVDPEILNEEAEGYQFSRTLDLPKTLNQCLQDTDTRGIKIRHRIKFNIQLQNPDGHTSELRATLPIALYISPSLRIDDDNNLVDQSPLAAQRAATDLAQQAPPLYGEHKFDQLYSDVDPSGYRTPGNHSSDATPFGSHSRNMSSENLASLDALTNGTPTTPSSGDVSASALHNRLVNLRTEPADTTSINGYDGSPPQTQHVPENFADSGDSPNVHSANGGSTDLSRRTSEESPTASGAQTPRVHFTEVEDLTRVPSYSTAVRTPLRTPLNGDLPTYHTATSSSSLSSMVPQAPRQAHLRGGWASQLATDEDATMATRPSSSPSLPNNGRQMSHSHLRQDEEARLRLMQARARG